MKKDFLKISWWLIPFLIILIGLLIPSCGFIGLLFDGDDENDSNRYYDVQISYNYSGGRTVSTFTPLVLLLIPLDNDMQFTDEGFDNAIYMPNYFSPGVASVLSLESGPYAILGYIDDQPFGSSDGQLNMGEVYAFYDMRDFISSFTNPDFIMVDSMIEDSMPHFDLDDSYTMNGLVIFSPRSGDTLKAVDVGGSVHLIQIGGISIEKSINSLDIYVNPPMTLVHDNVPVSSDDAWIVSVDMFGFSNGPYTLTVEGWWDANFIDSYSVDFNYESP